MGDKSDIFQKRLYRDSWHVLGRLAGPAIANIAVFAYVVLVLVLVPSSQSSDSASNRYRLSNLHTTHHDTVGNISLEPCPADKGRNYSVRNSIVGFGQSIAS